MKNDLPTSGCIYFINLADALILIRDGHTF
jgi:hypothetical protein